MLKLQNIIDTLHQWYNCVYNHSMVYVFINLFHSPNTTIYNLYQLKNATVSKKFPGTTNYLYQYKIFTLTT